VTDMQLLHCAPRHAGRLACARNAPVDSRKTAGLA
jgi:hypothetical protein